MTSRDGGDGEGGGTRDDEERSDESAVRDEAAGRDDEGERSGSTRDDEERSDEDDPDRQEDRGDDVTGEDEAVDGDETVDGDEPAAEEESGEEAGAEREDREDEEDRGEEEDGDGAERSGDGEEGGAERDETDEEDDSSGEDREDGEEAERGDGSEETEPPGGDSTWDRARRHPLVAVSGAVALAVFLAAFVVLVSTFGPNAPPLLGGRGGGWPVLATLAGVGVLWTLVALRVVRGVAEYAGTGDRTTGIGFAFAVVEGAIAVLVLVLAGVTTSIAEHSYPSHEILVVGGYVIAAVGFALALASLGRASVLFVSER